MKGELLAVAAALLWGIAPVLDKLALSSGVSIYAANVVRSLGAFAAIVAITAAMHQLDFSDFDAKVIAYLAVAGAIAGALAMILYFSALKSIGASRTVPITAAYPMFTALFSILFLGELVSLRVVAGIVAIVIGIILVSEV